MRSSWPLERGVALLSAATLEASWLMLAYLALQWLGGGRGVQLGLWLFAAAAAAGIVLARVLRDRPRAQFVVTLVGVTGAAAVLGTLATDLPQAPGTTHLSTHPGGWLLGVAVWRGIAHAELADEAEISESVLQRGVWGLIAFWLVATMTGMVTAREYTLPAFVATLAFVGAGLLSMGLARLVDLEVEAVDRAARRRWVGLVLGIIAVLVVVAVPVGAVLGVPVTSAVEAVAGPLAPAFIAIISLLAVPFSYLAELLVGLLRELFRPGSFAPLPQPSPQASAQPLQPGQPGFGPPDVAWLGLFIVLVGAAVALLLLAMFLRQPGKPRRGAAHEEVRETEPVDIRLPRLLPALHRPRRRRRAPHDAVEAYQLALASLDGGSTARHPAETPREHAARMSGSPEASDVRHLAADYQLAALGDRRLTPAEHARAIARWRRIARGRRRRPADSTDNIGG